MMDVARGRCTRSASEVASATHICRRERKPLCVCVCVCVCVYVCVHEHVHRAPGRGCGCGPGVCVGVCVYREGGGAKIQTRPAISLVPLINICVADL